MKLEWFLAAALLLAVPSARAQDGTDASHGLKIARAAQAQIGVTTIYDPAYVALEYPGGDVPQERGVCCDVVVRAFRKTGLDLQKLVHLDMKAHFSKYPRLWGLNQPDRNIDHRRVPNLQKFFERQGRSLPVEAEGGREDFRPGDVVAWRFPNNLYHIGIVSEEIISGTSRPWIIHNVGAGARKEDVLHAWKIIGHYRW